MEQKVAILISVHDRPGWPSSAVCQIVGVNPSLGIIYLKQLESRELVERVPSTRQGIHWKITGKGKYIIQRFSKIQRELSVI
jgi:predicted transcriptional regulator